MSAAESRDDALKRAMNLLGTKYGGAWYEGDRLHVATHGLTTTEQAELRKVLGPDVAIQATPIAFDQREAYVDLVSTRLESQGIEFAHVYVDVKSAKIVVITSADPAAIGELIFSAGIPKDLVVVAPTGGAWGVTGQGDSL
jgi:hypothetical protein